MPITIVILVKICFQFTQCHYLYQMSYYGIKKQEIIYYYDTNIFQVL